MILRALELDSHFYIILQICYSFITKQKIFLPQVVRVEERARTRMVQVYKPPPRHAFCI